MTDKNSETVEKKERKLKILMGAKEKKRKSKIEEIPDDETKPNTNVTESDSDSESWESDCPLFMTKLPKKPNPALDALSHILYEETTPEERAEHFKEEGNRLLKLGEKWYKDAIEYYTRAIDTRIQDPEKNSIYYANRAHVNLLLKNYGKVVNDCREAVKLNPKNVKAYYRGAKAANALEKYEEALKFCEGGLSLEPKNSALLAEKKIALEGIEILQRRDQQKQKELKEKTEKHRQLMEALRERHIVMGDFLFSNMRQYIESAPIYLDPQTKQIHWPVLFLYDEYQQSDFIKDFCEEDTFQQHLQIMFPEDHFVEWDTEKKYIWKNIEIYFIANQVDPLSTDDDIEMKSASQRKRKRKIRVRQTTTLKQVLQHKECVVPGFPVFYLVVTGSKFKEQFLKKPLNNE